MDGRANGADLTARYASAPKQKAAVKRPFGVVFGNFSPEVNPETTAAVCA
jgi:hypothetical protein